MNKLRAFVLSLVAAIASGVIFVPVQSRADISVGFFFDVLEPYGDWVEIGDYGYCWQPVVDEGWRPYTDGYWTYTDYGWTWVSNEDFGWAVYHYGRWVYLDDGGWFWVPDVQWAPAWVSWRRADDYIGWAPLPPAARYREVIDHSVDVEFDIGPGWFNFCEVRHFGAPRLRNVVIDRSRNVQIIRNTVNVTHIRMENNYIYNGGPDFDYVRRRSEAPIERVRLVRKEMRDPDEFRREGRRDGRGRARMEADELSLPVVARDATVPRDSERPEIKRRLGKSKATTGWEMVKDRGEREKWRESIRRDGARERPRGPEAADVASDAKRGGQDEKEKTPAAVAPPSTPSTQEGQAERSRRGGDRSGEVSGKRREKKGSGTADVLQPFQPGPESESARSAEAEKKRSAAKADQGAAKAEEGAAKAEQGAAKAEQERRRGEAQQRLDEQLKQREIEREQGTAAAEARKRQVEADREKANAGRAEASRKRQEELSGQRERQAEAQRQRLEPLRQNRETDSRENEAATEALRARQAEGQKARTEALRSRQEEAARERAAAAEQRARQSEAIRERSEATRQKQQSDSRERAAAYEQRRQEMRQQQEQRSRAQQERIQSTRQQQQSNREAIKARNQAAAQAKGKKSEEEEKD